MNEQVTVGRRRRLAYRFMLLLLGIAGAFLIAEVWVRVIPPMPVNQIIRQHNMHEIDGVPVWEEADRAENRSCVEEHPERLRILFFGTSITYGASLMKPEVFTTQLQDRLNRARPSPGFCVLNFAQPAFRYQQRYVVARQEIARYHPAAVFDQDWDTEWGGTACHLAEYKQVGSATFFLADRALRSDGLPGLEDVPDWLNGILFLHSRLYQYLVMAKGERDSSMCQRDDDAFRREQLVKFAKLTEAVGSKLGFFVVANLMQPMNEVRPEETAAHAPLFALGAKEGFGVYPLRELLSDQDNKAIRMDSWHFNAAGHRVLAERFERIVLDLLDGKPTPR